MTVAIWAIVAVCIIYTLMLYVTIVYFDKQKWQNIAWMRCKEPNSVKRSDATRWKQGYITPPPPYFILQNAVTYACELW